MTPLSLASDFPPADEAAWLALVEKALKGADFEKTLVSRTYDGLGLKPLYAPADETASSGLPGTPPYIRGFRAGPGEMPWDICQLHALPEPNAANEAILQDLNGGVSSICLQIAAPGQFGLEMSSPADLVRALDGVMLDLAGISLFAGANTGAAAEVLQALWREKDIAADRVSGAFNADPLGILARTGALPIAIEQALAEMAQLALTAQRSYPRMKAILVDAGPYHDGGASEAQELACLCATLTAYLRTLDAVGMEPADALSQMTFALAADADQFLSIAKLRAARAVIARIADVSGAAAAMPRVRLHATTSQRMLAEHDPWGNILRTTMATAAAALAGADAITVLPHTWLQGRADGFARRIARNVQIILQEESSLGAVLDPAGGSWYVESLSRELAETAWSLFQDIERDGGMMRALAKGTVQSMIAATAERRATAVATSAEEITGINSYPEISDSQVIVEPHPLPEEVEEPAITVEPVPLRRPSEPFDRMREASNFHFDQTGIRPAVFLVNLGTPADFTARAGYARNFFSAGGIETISSLPVATPVEAAAAFEESNAQLACLCSSDVVYASLAADVARALTQIGPRHLYLAGRPGDARTSLREAGIGTFIHEGCDMVETLRQAHDHAGIRPV